MSAITAEVPHSHPFVDQPRPARKSGRPLTIISPAPATAGEMSSSDRTTSDWRLTDRGIALVMVIAAMIMTAAIAVIGLTAVRVTGPSADPGVHKSQQAQY